MALIIVAVILMSSLAQGYAQEKKYFFTVTITTYPAKLDYVQYMVPYLQQLGINVEIESLTYSAMNALMDKNTAPKAEGGWDMTAGSFVVYGNQYSDWIRPFHTSSIYPEGFGNYHSYSSGKADRLIEDLVQEADVPKQKELLFKLQELLNEDLPLIPVFNSGGLMVFSKDVQGIKEFDTYQSARIADDYIYPSIYTKIPGKDTFVGAHPFTLSTFCPLLTYGFYTWTYTDGLMKVDASNQVVPSLAESWEFSEDRMVVTFHLRHEPIVWSDGVPFSSKDIKFSLDAIFNPALGGQHYGAFTKYVQSIEAPDDYTIIIRLKEKYAPILELLTAPVGAWTVPEHTFRDIPVEEWPTNPLFISGTFPSLGPYKMDLVEPGQYWRFKKNELWWGWKHLGIEPPYNYFIFKYIPEKTVALAAVEKGEVNHLSYWYHLESEFPRIKDNPNLQYDIVDTSLLEAFHINLNHPILGNKLVRQAINYALPRGAYVEGILNGIGKPWTGIMPSIFGEWVDPAVNQNPYDMAKAKELMEEAGFHYETLQPKTPDYSMFAVLLVVGIAIGGLATYTGTRFMKPKRSTT